MTQNNEPLKLRTDQIDLLRRAEEMDDPILLSGDAVETLRSILEPAAEKTGVRDPTVLSVEQLALQVSSEDEPADALVQNVETGDEPDADADADAADVNTDDVDAESLAERIDGNSDIAVLLSKSLIYDRRGVSDYATELRREAADALGDGVSADDLERALDRNEIDVPSDPKLVMG